jgi:hypothetical protein
MAKKTDFDLDGMDFENFEIDIPEWNDDGGNDDSEQSRKPITRVLRGTKDGLKSAITSKEGIRSALSLALPEGYSLAADTLEDIGTDAKSLYDKVAGESPELVRGSRKFSRRAMNLLGNKVLPKKVADRINLSLEDFDDVPSSESDYQQSQEDAKLQEIADIFKAQTALQEHQAKEDAVKEVEEKAVEQERFKSNIQALMGINRNLARLVSYQDKVTIKYQQKMLEFTYRQFEVTKKLLDVSAINADKQNKLLQNIQKNTALPEAVKIRGSEMFGMMAKQRLMDSGLNHISNWSQNYAKQITDNVHGMISGFVDPIKDVSGMTSEMDKSYLAGQMMGSEGGRYIRDWLAMTIAPQVKKIGVVDRFGETLRGAFTGVPQKINEFAQSETKGSGWKAAGLQMLKNFLPKFWLDSSVTGERVDMLDDVGTFDKIARRSLIEIIPGYLADIAHWTRASATGEIGDRKVYNPVRGGFTDETTQIQDVGRQIISVSERQSLRTSLNDFMQSIGADVLSTSAQQVLKRKLLDELANGRDLIPKRLADPESYPNVSLDIVDEITTLITDVFGLDHEGERADRFGDKNYNDIAARFYQLSSMVPDAGTRVRVLSDVLGKDVMRKLGFIERQGHEDRINQEAFRDIILNESDEESPTPPTPVRSNDVNLGRLIRDTVPFVNKTPLADADSADRADDQTTAQASRSTRGMRLDRWLGEKSLLINILKESRDYHAQTVELLLGLGSGSVGFSGKGEIPDSIRKAAEKAAAKWTSGRERAKVWIGKGKDKLKAGKVLARDIWIQGQDHPVLEQWRLDAKQYYDKASGNVIEKWEDISGDVVDIKNKTVVRFDDLMTTGVIADAKGNIQGIFNEKYGKFAETEFGKNVIERANKAAGSLGDLKTKIMAGQNIKDLPGHYAKKLKEEGKEQKKKMRPRWNKLMGFFSKKAGADVSSELTGEAGEDTVTLLLRSVQLQYETLKELTKDKVRKGSFTDIFNRRKEKEADDKNAPEPKTEGIQGILARTGLLGMLADKLGLGGDDEGGDTNIDILSTGGGDADDGRNRRRNPGGNNRPRPQRPRGKWGWTKWGVKKAWNFATWGVRSAWKLGGSILGSKAVRSAVGFGLRKAVFPLLGGLLAAAGIAAAPVVAAAGVIATGVSIGMWVYDIFKEKPAPLTRLRLAQYGIKPDLGNKYLEPLAKLEKYAVDLVNVDADGKAKFDYTKIDVATVAQIFGADATKPNNPQMIRLGSWIKGRFATVFTKWISSFYSVDRSKDLTKVDEKLKGKVALEFLEKVSFSSETALFDIMVSPFEDDDELQMDADDVEDIYESVKKTLRQNAEREALQRPDNSAALSGAAGTAAQAAAQTVEGYRQAADNPSDRSAPRQGREGARDIADGYRQAAQGRGRGVAANNRAVAATLVAGAGAAVVTATTKTSSVTDRVEELDDGKPVRFRAYGLTEMDATKVGQLSQLEAFCFANVKYDSNKQAQFDDETVIHQEAERIFQPVGSETDKVYIWFYRRFLPVFKAFCSSVREHASIDAKDAAKRLDTDKLLEALRTSVNARDNAGISVWDIPESPWAGYVLGRDPESVKEALAVLESKVRTNVLSEDTGINRGRRRDAHGNLVEEDGSQTNRPGRNSRGRNRTNGSGQPESAADNEEGGFFSRWFSGGSKPPQGGHMTPEGQNTSNGPAVQPSGPPVSHPGGGTGGDVNTIPEPAGDGWEANRATLMAAANMVGVDPALAASIAGVESSWKPHARPYKNPKDPSKGVLSSAASYYQVINSTWKYLMDKYADKYGIHPDTTQADPRANALLGLEYIRENINTIKSAVNRPITDTDVYLAHFLGPGGAKRFLSAPGGAAATLHVGSDQASSNPGIFFDSSGRPRTVNEVYRDFERKLTNYRKDDASSLAAQLRQEQTGKPDSIVEEEIATTASTALDTPALPSMVQPEVPDTLNRTIERDIPTQTPPASSEDSDERIVNRQIRQETMQVMTTNAATADTRSSAQAERVNSPANDVDKGIGSLLSVNESQLAQLIRIAELIGKMAPGTVSPESTPSTTQARTAGSTRRREQSRTETVSMSRS